MPIQRKKVLFAIILGTVPPLILVLALFAADLYCHHRFGKSAGLNYKGYRGPVLSKKETGENRLVVLGGSTAFGYGVTNEKSFPSQLERRLSQHGRFTVANLGYNNQGAFSFLPTLEDYLYLDYDGVIFYEGYNDLGGENRALFRHDSAIFQWIGYFPLLPTVLGEKALAIRYNGDLEAGYRSGSKAVFGKNSRQELLAGALENMGRVIAKADATTSQSNSANHPVTQKNSCLRYSFYCDSVAKACRYALGHGKKVIVVSQPGMGEDHFFQQDRLHEYLEKNFGASIAYVDLRKDVRLNNPAVRFDGMHLTEAGNGIVAEDLEKPVLATFTGRDLKLSSHMGKNE